MRSNGFRNAWNSKRKKSGVIFFRSICTKAGHSRARFVSATDVCWLHNKSILRGKAFRCWVHAFGQSPDKPDAGLRLGDCYPTVAAVDEERVMNKKVSPILYSLIFGLLVLAGLASMPT